MKRYLLIFIGLLFSYLAFGQTVITGKVAPQSDTTLGVAYVPVKAYQVGNPTNVLSQTTTNINGEYTLTVDTAYTQAVISLTDKCGEVHEDTLTLSGGTLIHNFFVPCPFIGTESLIKVVGRILDDNGNPVPNYPVNITTFSNQGTTYASQVSTDMGGNFFYESFYDYFSGGDTAVEFSVRDYCGNYFYRHITLPQDSNKIVEDTIVFEVPCGPKNLIYISGEVSDGNGKVWSKAGIKAQYLKDKYKQVYINTDTNGTYYIAMPKPVFPDDSLILTVVDSNGNAITDTIQITNDLNYYRDLVVPTKPYVAFIVNGIANALVKTAANGVVIEAHYEYDPSAKGQCITNDLGEFTIGFLAPDFGAGSYSVEVYSASCASDTVYLPYDGNPFFDNVQLNNVECSDPNMPNYINFEITAIDTAGNLVDNVTGFVTTSFNTYDLAYKTYQGTAYMTLNIPKDSMYIRYGIEDFGHIVYDTIVLFDYTKYSYTDTFVVNYSQPLMATVQGYVYGQGDLPVSGAVIKAYLANVPDSDTIFTRADNNGFYKITAEAPPEGALVALIAIDSCGNIDSTTFTFTFDTLNYTKNIVSNTLQCSYSNADTVLRISGLVQDVQGVPAPYVLVSAMYLNASYDPYNQDFKQFYGVTDQNGHYTIKMPLPMMKDTVIVSIYDSCYNYYEQKFWFDYATFEYNNIDFTGQNAISCPPSAPQQISASMTIGMEQDWNNYRNYVFYAYLISNLGQDVYPNYFIWYIGDDTVVTVEPSLAYTFGATDTCVNVHVQAVFSGNYMVTSQTMNVCVQNVFDNIGTQCYADFVSSTFDSAGLNFEFYPFIFGEADLAPTQVIWDFGDGQSITLTQNFDSVITHAYAQPGAYDVTLTVNFANSDASQTCQAVWSEPVWAGSDVWYPQDSCAAAFYVTEDPDSPLTVYFQDISYPGQYSDIEYYYWDFGDSTTSTAPSPTHTYPAADNYTVYMEIITNSMCYSNFTMTIPVGQNLLPIMFYPDTTGSNVKVTGYGVKFYNISKTNSDKWSWDFGEEEKGAVLKTSDDYIIHYYADTGYYDVTLLDGNTGAGMTMRIHVTGDSSVVPLWAALVAANPATGVNETVKLNILDVYPNPATDVLFVSLDHSATSGLIEVYTLTGRLVKRMVITNMQNISLDVKDLAPGSYLIKAAYDGKVGIAKFVKR